MNWSNERKRYNAERTKSEKKLLDWHAKKGRKDMITTSKNSYLTYTTLVILIVSSIWIILSNNGRIIVSADFDDSLLLWQHWLIVGIPFIILYFLPYKNQKSPCLHEGEKQTLKAQTHYLLFTALLYFLALIITPAENVFDYFYIYKLIFLLFVPLIIFKWKPYKIKFYSHSAKKQWKFALIPVFVWIFMYYFSPWGSTESNTYEINFLILLTGALVSFLLNSVLEELFYRVWLQTRLELFLGTWPAICVSALLWAVWHVTIQSAGTIDVTIANSIANHGLMGLFLGLLWSKYRNFWVLVIVHGLANFPLEIISKLLGE